ncbi:MAG TPA: hypothetical protein DCF33_03115 [Saprospirales bacterium]|nr:hypothetical protein [Saprospirales bacterium]
MEPRLTAAEIKTLENPQNEQVKLALSLFLKELILLGWVNTKRGKRPIHSGLWLFIVLAIGGFAIHFAIGTILGFLILAYIIEARKDQTLLYISAEGENKLSQSRQNASTLIRMLKTVADARPNDQDHCTSKEWRKHLGLYYPNNASFHQEFLVGGLVKKGLLEYGPDKQPVRTAAGDALLYKARTEIQKGQELPRLLREKSSNAAAMAAQLAGLVLLVPGIEGYFGHLFEHVGYLDAEMDDLRRKSEDSYGSGDAGSDTPDKETEEGTESDSSSDNGSDWQNDADFLDGVDDDTSDTGVGSDSGDGGGDGGDGGDGGGCSVCGGCGGWRD